MKAHKGYYSVIQYCPDRGRAEVANVGVLVFCPETDFIDAQMSTTIRRIERVFGRGTCDPWWIKNVKRSLAEGIRHERERFRTLEDLERFIATRGNELVFTPPRAIRIENPEADMQKLFSELVGGKHGATGSAATLVPQLNEVFHRLAGHRPSVQVRWSYDVPDYPRKVHADYYYENGVANLVRLLPIGAKVSSIFNTAIALGGESVFVKKHVRPNSKEASLVVVAARGSNGHDGGIEERLVELYKDFPDAKLIRSDGVAAFARSVERDAK